MWGGLRAHRYHNFSCRVCTWRVIRIFWNAFGYDAGIIKAPLTEEDEPASTRLNQRLDEMGPRYRAIFGRLTCVLAIIDHAASNKPYCMTPLQFEGAIDNLVSSTAELEEAAKESAMTGTEIKRPTMSDEQKSVYADMIGDLLELQLVVVGDSKMDSQAGGPKPKAIGYVYGYVDAVLRTKGLDMADSEIGPPITFQVVRRLWPGKEREYFDFLAEHLSDPVVGGGMMHGGQQYIDSLKAENSENAKMGLARYILTEV